MTAGSPKQSIKNPAYHQGSLSNLAKSKNSLFDIPCSARATKQSSDVTVVLLIEANAVKLAACDTETTVAIVAQMHVLKQLNAD
ncbi:hypothetical protein [Pseudophaeobacter arcticus]|jgi:hypothetical protein|uniref:hypothetical protein n=1 Tax=Pseudophaeobacter arcticus TaxID=385492 RepID=UPI001376DC46|nr:hypothetical protein [Pseudophaeobacter arcticus]